MKKISFGLFFFAYALLGICALSGCDAENLSDLRDITRPYAGEYLCTKLSFGGEDMLSRLDPVLLSLSPGGGFCLASEDGDGYSGSYSVSEKEQEITFVLKEGGEERKYVFPYQKGRIFVRLNLEGKLLYAEFSPPA